jgi:hypothetical protein
LFQYLSVHGGSSFCWVDETKKAADLLKTDGRLKLLMTK